MDLWLSLIALVIAVFVVAWTLSEWLIRRRARAFERDGGTYD